MESVAIGIRPVREAKGRALLLLLFVVSIGVSIGKMRGTGNSNIPELLFRLMLMMDRSGLF